nr:LacI family DNA-binding transcriptional regulator [Shouchella tritolerans]
MFKIKPKISDVAKAAGVSPTTVSRVMNKRGYISEETRQKVYDAMKKLNYIPNDLARSLYNKRSNLIGLIVPTTANPFYGELTARIEHFCALAGLKVLLCNSLHNAEKEAHYWEMLRRNQVDGVIVCTYNRGLIDVSEQMPTVAFDHYLSSGIPVISSDNYAGGELAAATLIEAGCKCIVHINGPAELETPANLRRSGYEAVMQRYGLPAMTYEIRSILSQAEAEAAICALFDHQPNMDGVFASDDSIALKVIQEARRRNKRVPEDVKVIGYDGTEFVRQHVPELTTIKQPMATMAETAVQILIQQIEQPDKALEKEYVHSIELVRGHSV